MKRIEKEEEEQLIVSLENKLNMVLENMCRDRLETTWKSCLHLGHNSILLKEKTNSFFS
jgi:hypothetical protein